MQQWADVASFLLEEATADLCETGDIRPCMVAFRGEQPLFVAFLRSFAPGTHADPLIELLALAAPLDADRIAVSLGGRAWSFADPIPPVVEGVGDLRQRVLCTVAVDASGAPPAAISRIRPFAVVEGEVLWADEVVTDGGEGWTVEALALVVESRSLLQAESREIGRQARRCVALGHLLALAPEVALDIGVAGRETAG